MISNLRELNDKIFDLVNQIVSKACINTTTGDYTIDLNLACIDAEFSVEDLQTYSFIIENEIKNREEFLEANMYLASMKLDVRCAKEYCSFFKRTEEKSFHDFDVENDSISFYVGDGITLDKTFNSFGVALQKYGELVDKKFEDVSLGFCLSDEKGIYASLPMVYSSDGLVEVINLDTVLSLETKSEYGDINLIDKYHELFEFAKKYCPENDFEIGKWRVHVVKPGDSYGNNNGLVYDEKKSLIEFWDMSADKTAFPQGQFVSRYYIETLFDDSYGNGPDILKEYGLSLWADIPAWSVNGSEMCSIIDWLCARPFMSDEHYKEYHCEVDVKCDNYSAARELLERKIYGLPFIGNDYTVEDVGAFNEGYGLSVTFKTQAPDRMVVKHLEKAINVEGLNCSYVSESKVVPKKSLERLIEACDSIRDEQDNSEAFEKGNINREIR